MKNKYVATALAFFLGIFGVHRFYLSQRFLGIIYFILFCGGIILTIGSHGEAPLVALPALLGFIDSVLLAVMPKAEFDEKYNRKWLRRQAEIEAVNYEETPPVARPQPTQQRATAGELKRSGIEKFRNYDYEGAIADFEQVLSLLPYDAPTHFNLACSYSLLEQKEKAFRHLQLAVDAGFKQFEKIDQHDALAFLRAQPEFDAFVQNGYRLWETAAATAKPPAQSAPLILEDDLLDQIIKLGELREKGILTEEEFALQKQRILNKR